MNLATKILEKNDLKEELIEVEEWCASVVLREMTGAQRAEWIAHAKKAGEYIAMVRMFIGCALDPDTRKPIFEPAHQDALMAKSGGVLDRLMRRIAVLSGIALDSQAEAEKNSTSASD